MASITMKVLEGFYGDKETSDSLNLNRVKQTKLHSCYSILDRVNTPIRC